MGNLEAAFHEAMLDLYKVVRKECPGYNPTLFLQMVSERGGFAAAKALIHADQVSTGFTRLWELHHLDLTVEAFILNDPWRSLFSEDELHIAERRLEAYGFIR